VIFGDNGFALCNLSSGRSVITEIRTTDPEYGDRDVIFAANGEDVVLGGSGADDIDAGTDGSRDIVIGDNGEAFFDADETLLTIRTTAPGFGGNDDIRTGNGFDVVMGGDGDDFVLASGQDGFAHARDLILAGLFEAVDPGDSAGDIVLGDDGEAFFNGEGVLLEILSINPANGGKDVLVTGNGPDIVIAGADDDFVLAAGTDQVADIVIGDSGRATFDRSETYDAGEEHAILSFNFTGKDRHDDIIGVAGAAVDPENGTRAGNWNNLEGGGLKTYGNDAGELVYFDDGEIAPGITIQWGADLDSTGPHDPDELHEEDHNQINPGDDQDKRLFDGYLSTDYHDTVGVNIAGLSSHFEAYDVYVYLDMDDQDSRSGTSVRSVTDGTTKYYLDDPDGNTFTGTYVEVLSTDPNAAQKGNYVVFRGLTSDQVSLRIDDYGPNNSSNKPGVAAVQVVGTRNPIDRIETLYPASGGNDLLLTGGGPDIVFGGSGNDLIVTYGNEAYGGIDGDIVAGDDARATFMLGELREVKTWNPDGPNGSTPGADIIYTGNGADVVIGGNDGDVIDSGVRGGYDYGELKVVSINFNSEVDKGVVNGTAGAVAVENWNNLPSDGKGSMSNLVADDGGVTGVKAQWGEEEFSKKNGYQLSGSAEQESNDQLYPDTQNERLFEGSLEVDHRTLGVDLSGLAELGVYDVYVYFSNDDDGYHDHEHDAVKISAGGTSYYVEEGSTFDGTFVDASSTDRCVPGRGNYVVFRGLTLDQLSIRLSGDDWNGHHDDGEASIAGIQIVSGAGRAQAIDVAAGRIGGDFDKDLVFGDNAIVRWFGGEIYEALATNPVATAGDSTFQSDTITSGEGADIVVGGNGNDHIFGGEGHDLLLGDNARLLFFKGGVIGLGDGNPGNWDDDRHNDNGDEHDDHFNVFEVCGIQLLNATVGGNDVIEGGKDDDLMYGQFGNDTYVFAGGGLGRDYIVEAGCNGPNDLHDRLDFSQFVSSVNIDLGDSCQQTINCGTLGGDINLRLTLFRGDSIEDVTGSEFADRIEGNNRNNILIGRAGDDHIEGDGGDDVILGMDGNDELSGGYGEDLIDGGAGNDRIYGGHGDHDNDHAHDNDGDWWKRSYGADILLGGSGDDKIWGNQGNDLIDGEDGDDYLDGDCGDDIVIGGNGNDYLVGGSGKDMLEGGEGTDTLKKDKYDLLVEQNTKVGQLGLMTFFHCYAPQFSQDGFSYQDPSGGDTNLDDRPARAWVALYSGTLPGIQATSPASANVAKSLSEPSLFEDSPGDIGLADSPTIDWSVKFFDNSGLPKTSSSAWLGDFVNHLAQNEAQRNPNAGMKVHI